MGDFSRRGEKPTQLELALVASTPVEASGDGVALWLGIAQLIGAAALAIVLDEAGGEKLHVPTRVNFFGALYRRQRDRIILERRASGESLEAVGRDFGLTAARVSQIALGIPNE